MKHQEYETSFLYFFLFQKGIKEKIIFAFKNNPNDLQYFYFWDEVDEFALE